MAYLMNHQKSVKQRLVVLALIVGAVFFVNDLLKYSFHYRLQHKVESFERLTKLLNDPQTDSASKHEAAALREELLAVEPLWVHVYVFFFPKLNGGFSKSTNIIANPNRLMLPTINMSMMSSISDYFKLIISTSGVFLMTGIVLAIWVVVKSKDSLSLALTRLIMVMVATGVAAAATHCIILLWLPAGLSWRGILTFNALSQYLLLTMILITVTVLKNRSR